MTTRKQYTRLERPEIRTFKAVPTVTSEFALVDIQIGREAIARAVEAGHEIPFTISGVISPGKGGVGHDDGVSIEFASEVHDITLGTPKLVPMDTFGRRWAMADEVKPGDRLECDPDFTCMKAGSKHTVFEIDGHHFIKCKDGKHFLNGQLGDHGELIGLYLVR